MAQPVKDIIEKLGIKMLLCRSLGAKQNLMNEDERMALKELHDSIISDTMFIAGKRSKNGRVASHALGNEGEITFKDCFMYYVMDLMKFERP